MGYKTKVCVICRKEYQPTDSSQKWCSKCKVIGKHAYDKTYSAMHKEEIKVKDAGNYAVHPERKTTITAWRNANPEKAKAIRHKHRAKRRALGFNPLNSWFVGCEGHHINKRDVVHMPRKLHRSIWHCQRTGQGMAEMNGLAGQYLTEDWT